METYDKRMFLSPESLEIIDTMGSPLSKRASVVYNENFLSDYSPNTSRYFSEEICERLKILSKADRENTPGAYIKKILNDFLTELVWNSCRIAGNSYTLLETEHLFDTGESGEGKKPSETQLLLNHKSAIEHLVNLGENIQIDRSIILQLHAIIYKGLNTTQAEISEMAYHPLDNQDTIDRCFDNILEKANQIQNPFEKAFFLLIHLSYLQPSKTILARLVANIPFFFYNLSPLSYLEIPTRLYIKGMLGIYELKRIDLLRDLFVWGYSRSSLFYSRNPNLLESPNQFRLKYEVLISEAVSTIVRQGLNKKERIISCRLMSNKSLSIGLK